MASDARDPLSPLNKVDEEKLQGNLTVAKLDPWLVERNLPFKWPHDAYPFTKQVKQAELALYDMGYLNQGLPESVKFQLRYLTATGIGESMPGLRALFARVHPKAQPLEDDSSRAEILTEMLDRLVKAYEDDHGALSALYDICQDFRNRPKGVSLHRDLSTPDGSLHSVTMRDADDDSLQHALTDEAVRAPRAAPDRLPPHTTFTPDSSPPPPPGPRGMPPLVACTPVSLGSALAFLKLITEACPELVNHPEALDMFRPRGAASAAPALSLPRPTSTTTNDVLHAGGPLPEPINADFIRDLLTHLDQVHKLLGEEPALKVDKYNSSWAAMVAKYNSSWAAMVAKLEAHSEALNDVVELRIAYTQTSSIVAEQRNVVLAMVSEGGDVTAVQQAMGELMQRIQNAKDGLQLLRSGVRSFDPTPGPSGT